METTILSATFDSKYQNRLINDLIMADYYIHLWGANNRVSSHKSVVDPYAEESYTYRHDIFSASRARDIVIRINHRRAIFHEHFIRLDIEDDSCFINVSRKYNFPCFLIHINHKCQLIFSLLSRSSFLLS